MGASACVRFQPLSPDALTCEVPAGSGARLPVVVVVVTQAGFKTSNGKARWSYDAPRVDTVSPSHAPAAGGATVRLHWVTL